MVIHQKRLVFAGVFVGALAVTSYLPRLVQNALHHNQSLSDGYDDSGTVEAMPDRAPASGAVSTDLRGDNSPTRILQAVRDSLQRNDLQSAEILLRAARALDINNPQAIALQNELDGRMTQNVSPALSAKGAVTPQRTESGSVIRANRTASRTAQKRERSQPAPSQARDAARTHANLGTSISPPISTPTNPVAPTPEVTERPKPTVDLVPDVEVARAPESVTASIIASPPMVQPIVQQTMRPAPAPVVESSQGPKSREQVRAELERARTDGSLPRFGNPDPAGPGVSTISKPLSGTTNR
jgi:hypothetical protein